MENIGALSLLIAFCLAVFAVVAAVTGKYTRRPLLTVSAERAVYAVWILVTTASAALVYSLIIGDYRLAYVAAHSNKAMSTIYKFTAWWGGQEGSLLFWGWLLSTYSAIAVYTNRRKFRDMMPLVTAIMMTVLSFFIGMITFVASPFRVLMAGRGIIDVGDGNGLSPLLQWWTMAIHPPFLYLGYVGFTVPFAFAMASLISKQPGEGWIHTTRRWAILTWLFQTTGVMLGMGWAYTVLGWGGYWGWDPVENASLHALDYRDRLSAFGHDAGKEGHDEGLEHGPGIGHLPVKHPRYYAHQNRLGFLCSRLCPIAGQALLHHLLLTAVALTAFAIIKNLPYLKSEVKLESVVSRESSFLFNNLILLASCFAVLWGTLFPVLMEALTNEKESIDAPYYNRVNIPIALFLYS